MTSAVPCLPFQRQLVAERTKLFCFPHAGGSASHFLPWRSVCGELFDVLPMQYPGRETRIRESMPADVASLVTELCDSIERCAVDAPFVLYGHSFGALLAYEVSVRLCEAGRVRPQLLVASGCASPRQFRLRRALHALADRALVEDLSSYGGVPAELLSSPDWVEIVAAVARADFELCARYRCVHQGRLDIPILCLAGMDDEWATPMDMQRWSEYTHARFELHVFPGQHFFHLSAIPRIVQLIANGSARSVEPQPSRTRTPTT